MNPFDHLRSAVPLAFLAARASVSVFFDWLHTNPRGMNRWSHDRPSFPACYFMGVLWILPLVGVCRCLSRVVGLSLTPLRNK